MNHKYYFSIASMFKNESWGLKEWIDHNHFHGVDHIYLIDDFSEDDYLPVLQPYIDSGYVTLFHNDMSDRFKGRQIHITNKYLLPICKESFWIANVDIDEYLYSPKNVNLKDVLRKYENYGDLHANWVWFNSNGFVKQPDGIVKNFTSRAEYGKYVFSRAQIAEGQYESTGACKSIANSNFNIRQFNVHETLTDGETLNLSYTSNPDDPELLLNHYQLQSREYWEKIKMWRRDTNEWYIYPRGWGVFETFDVGDIIDERLKKQNAEEKS